MTITTDPPRWTFTMPTPLGKTQSTYAIDDDALRFESEDPLGGSMTLGWSSIRHGGTAAMAGMGSRGAPDMPDWIPAQLEWLLLSRSGGEPLMRPLPQGAARDALVAAVRERLGSRWLGEKLELKDAQRRMDIQSGEWSTLKVVGIVVAVLASLVLLIMALGILLHPVIMVPVGVALGGWIFRKGLQGLRDGIAVANTPNAKVASAAVGLVELHGRAVTAEPLQAAITGRPCVWWDVTVSLWYEDSDRNHQWRQVAARYGGRIDVIELEDDTGRVPVWLKGANRLLTSQSWRSSKSALPARGLALLNELGFPWNGSRDIMVTEECLEADATLYVLGTLGERRHVPGPGEMGLPERLSRLLRTGEWKRRVVAAMPGPGKIVAAVLIGYLEMMFKIGTGTGGARSEHADDSSPPSIEPAALLVWKGREGRPFLVSNQPESAALASLRRRSLWTCGLGAALLSYVLYAVVDWLFGKR